MNIVNTVSALLLVTVTTHALATTEPVTPEPVPAPPGLSLRAFTYSGPGCPPSSGDLSLTWNDEGALVMRLPNMVAEWGPGISKLASRQSCVLTLDIAVPEGWQYALKSWDARGFVEISAGLRAEVGIQYFFEGGPTQRQIQNFQGPFEDAFVSRDLISISAMQWSSCDKPRKLAVNSIVRILQTEPQPQAWGWAELGTHWDGNPLKLGFEVRRCAP